MEERTESAATNPSPEEIIDAANEELKVVLENLKAARKVLARDWEAMTPRERSSQARIVRQIEARQAELLETLDMYRGA